MIVIDFFCGCGGASEGLRQAGFDIELGLDIDQQASETFKANFPDAKFIQDDIRKIEPQDISDIIDIKAKRPLLLSACAPVSYTTSPSPRDRQKSRMPSSA